MSKWERLRLLTPTLVSIGIALLGVVLSDMRDLQRDVTDVRERLARVETSLVEKNRATARRRTADEMFSLRRASESSARAARLSMEVPR